MDNFDIQKISSNILKFFEVNYGITKDTLLILCIIAFLILEDSNDFLLILVLIMLIK